MARGGRASSRGEGLGEGDEYLHTSKVLPFRDAVESVWVVERMEQLKEVHFRCTLSGTYARFTLTPAQGHTFVEAESGMEPTALRWRVLGVARPVLLQELGHRRCSTRFPGGAAGAR